MIESSDYMSLVRLPGGRQLVVVRRMKEVAPGLKLAALSAALQRAEALITERIALEARFVAQRDAGSGRVEGGELDRLIDTACGIIDRTCETALEGERINPAKAKHARTLRAALFPAGLAAVVRVSYEEELAQLIRIKEALGAKEIKAALSALALKDESQLILDNLDAYEAAIKRAGGQVHFKDLAALRRRCHEAMCLVVATVLSTLYDPSDAAHVDGRARLLAPLDEQVSVVRAQRRARGPRTDLDPVTGDELPIDSSLSEG
jgi:hypothetical protein